MLPPSLRSGAPVQGTHSDGVHVVADPIASDPLSEFPSERSSEPCSTIIEIIPARFLNNPGTAPPPCAATNAQHRSPVSISALMAVISVVRRSAVRMIGSIYLTTRTRGFHAAAQLRAIAVIVSVQLRRLSRRLTTQWRAAWLLAASLLSSAVHAQLLRRLTTKRHTTPQVMATTAPVWPQTRRHHSMTVKSPLLAFFGGITVGAAIMWSFDLPSSMNGFIAEGPVPSVAAQALSLSSDDLPRHPASLTASAVPTPTPHVTNTKIPAAAGERRPTTTRTVAVPNKTPVVSRPVAASSPTARFRGTLAIDSVVPGARVFINGQPVGVTPVVLKNVPAGSRAVRVEATGYGTWSASLQVTANRQTRVMAKLDRVIPAVSK